VNSSSGLFGMTTLSRELARANANRKMSQLRINMEYSYKTFHFETANNTTCFKACVGFSWLSSHSSISGEHGVVDKCLQARTERLKGCKTQHYSYQRVMNRVEVYDLMIAGFTSFLTILCFKARPEVLASIA